MPFKPDAKLALYSIAGPESSLPEKFKNYSFWYGWIFNFYLHFVSSFTQIFTEKSLFELIYVQSYCL